MTRPFVAHGLRPPDSRIANGGTEFEYRAGIDHQRKLLQYACYRRADDRHFVRRRRSLPFRPSTSSRFGSME